MNKKLGALWRHQKDGKNYFTGNIEVIAGIQTKIVIFANEPKAGAKLNAKAPTYNIFLPEPMKQDKVATEKIAD